MTTPLTRKVDFQETVEQKGPATQQNSVQKSSVWYAFFTAISLGFGTLIFLYQLIKMPSSAPSFPQLLALFAVFSIATLFSILCASPTIIRDIRLRVIILVVCIEIASLAVSALVVNMGVPAALITLLASVIIIFALLPRGQGDVAVSGVLGFAVVISLINLYSPFSQITVPRLEIFIISLLGILIMGYVVLFSFGFIPVTLRINLISTILAIVLLSIILLSIIQNRISQSAIQDQINQSLLLAATNTASKVDDFFQTIYFTIGTDASLPMFSDYLNKAKTQPPTDQDIVNLRKAINSLIRSRQLSYLLSYAVLDDKGKNMVDTNPVYVSTYENNNDYFVYPMTTGLPFSSNVRFDPNGKPIIYISSPIRDQSQQIIGILRIAYDAHILQQLIKDNSSNLGSQSYPALYDENLIRIADAITPENLYRAVAPLSDQVRNDLISNRRLPSLQLDKLSTNLPVLAKNLQNYLKQPFFTTVVMPSKGESINEVAAVVPLKMKPWILGYYMDQSVIAKTGEQQTRATILIATLLAGFVGILATITARVLSAPINNLTNTVEQIAGGNLNVKAKVESSNEIGTLAYTFNLMTDQLSTLVNELEQRVLARTRLLGDQNEILQYRSRQLETISDVANSITSTQDLEVLLNKVTSLISERFGFYHVGVFLLDQNGEFAILRATNSAGGKRMLARRHRLSVGQVGIVGYVTGKGIPRIATDVGKDAVFFNNPDLPETRSEMALPLVAGDKIIGALDVQSKESNAFSQSDIELFTILADQIAIAIVNNRLYEDTAQALVDMQNLHRQYMRQEWGKETSERDRLGYLYTPQGVVKQNIAINSPDIQDVLETSRIVIRTDESEGQSTSMAVPIILRGETIGVIQLQESGTTREWSDDEIATVQSVAEQVALALENARLFEQTVRRAERERKVLEITSKIRSTTDPQAMLRIALEELQQALNASRTQIVLQHSEIIPEAIAPGDNGHNQT